MKQAKLFYIPSSSSRIYCGHYAVAEKAAEALEVLKQAKVDNQNIVHDDITINDLVLIDEKITLPNRPQKVKRILNTYGGLIDINIIKYFNKPSFFGSAWKIGLPYNEIPEISLSPEAWDVYSFEYDARGWIIFQADDMESGLKIRVEGGSRSASVIWMYTYDTETEYEIAEFENNEVAVKFALSRLNDAKILRERYRNIE